MYYSDRRQVVINDVIVIVRVEIIVGVFIAVRVYFTAVVNGLLLKPEGSALSPAFAPLPYGIDIEVVFEYKV